MLLCDKICHYKKGDHVQLFRIHHLICLFFAHVTQCMLLPTYHHTPTPYQMHRLTVAHFVDNLFTVGFSNGDTGSIHIVNGHTVNSVHEINTISPFFTVKKLSNSHLACTEPGAIKIFDITTGQCTRELPIRSKEWPKYIDGQGHELYTANSSSRDIIQWDVRDKRGKCKILETMPNENTCVSSLAQISATKLCWTEDLRDSFYVLDTRKVQKSRRGTPASLHRTDAEEFSTHIRTRDIHAIYGKGVVIAQRAYNGEQDHDPRSRLLRYTLDKDILQPFLMAHEEEPIISFCVLPQESIVSFHKNDQMFHWDTEKSLVNPLSPTLHPPVAMASSPEGNLAWITRKKNLIHFAAQNEAIVYSYPVPPEYQKDSRMYQKNSHAHSNTSPIINAAIQPPLKATAVPCEALREARADTARTTAGKPSDKSTNMLRYAPILRTKLHRAWPVDWRKSI